MKDWENDTLYKEDSLTTFDELCDATNNTMIIPLEEDATKMGNFEIDSNTDGNNDVYQGQTYSLENCEVEKLIKRNERDYSFLCSKCKYTTKNQGNFSQHITSTYVHKLRKFKQI